MSDETWIYYGSPFPLPGGLVEDCSPGAFRKELNELFLDALHAPRYGPPKPYKRHVSLPAGKPAGKYRKPDTSTDGYGE